MDMSGIYESSNGTIKNITPIHTDHLLSLLGKSGNKETRDEIVNLFKRIENTKVGISCDQDLGDDINIHNTLARFFEVEGVQFVRRRSAARMANFYVMPKVIMSIRIWHLIAMTSNGASRF